MFADTGFDFSTFFAWGMFQFILLIAFWLVAKRFATPLQYRDYLYEPLDPADLPRRTRDRFDLHAADFCRLGFERVEDTRLQRKPFRHDLRLLLSARGDAWGEINVARNFWTILRCVSVFDDGMKIETASIPPRWQPEPQDRMQWNTVFCGSVEEIYHKHLEAVEHYQTEAGAEALAFAPEDAHDVLTYELRLYGHWYRRMGLTKEPIPEAVLPQPRRTAMLS